MEFDFVAYVDFSEELARGCASTGWTVGNLLIHHWMLALYDERAQEEVWGANPDALIASGIAYPQGHARRVEGGYSVGGRWNFSSGVDASEWSQLAAMVREGERVVDYRMCLLHQSQYEIVDDWNVLGMRGTGSKTVVAKDVFVPAHRALCTPDARGGGGFPGARANPNPVYRVPFSAVGAHGLGGTAVGNAQAALELSIEAGLIGKGDDGHIFDRMRGRVIFPIADRRGRVIAFGGRILGEGQPKYLNSPETPLFHKGRTLYGLGQALRPARDAGEIVVAEGYMDVIALAQAGFAQAVAPLGTALTEDQMGELWRLVPEPTLCFDGDAAGERAAARAAERALPLLKPGQSLRFALLPAGEDPDTLIIAQGASAMRAVLDAALPLAEMVWRGGVAGRNFDTPERRAGLRQEIRERLSRIADRPVHEAYRVEFERRLDRFFGLGQAAGPRFEPGRPGDRRRFAPPQALGGEAARQRHPAGGDAEQDDSVTAARPPLRATPRVSSSLGEPDRVPRRRGL